MSTLFDNGGPYSIPPRLEHIGGPLTGRAIKTFAEVKSGDKLYYSHGDEEIKEITVTRELHMKGNNIYLSTKKFKLAHEHESHSTINFGEGYAQHDEAKRSNLVFVMDGMVCTDKHALINMLLYIHRKEVAALNNQIKNHEEVIHALCVEQQKLEIIKL